MIEFHSSVSKLKQICAFSSICYCNLENWIHSSLFDFIHMTEVQSELFRPRLYIHETRRFCKMRAIALKLALYDTNEVFIRGQYLKLRYDQFTKEKSSAVSIFDEMISRIFHWS